jgi:hypothetical protein
MIALPIAAAALNSWTDNGSKEVLVAEIAGIYVFGLFWCVKSWELGKSDGERDIARGRVVRVRGGALARVPLQAGAEAKRTFYPTELRTDGVTAMTASATANADARP